MTYSLSTLFIRLLFICCLSSATICGALAYELPPQPADGVQIVDLANILDLRSEREMDEIAKSLKMDRGVSLFVLTIDKLPKVRTRLRGRFRVMGVENYARAIFQTWSIGSRAHNYGILVLIAKEDRKARIQFGTQWRHAYDADAQRIMDTVIMPSIRKSDYSIGTLRGVRELDNLARYELKFEIDKTKIAKIVLAFTIVISALTVPMFLRITQTGGREDWPMCGA